MIALDGTHLAAYASLRSSVPNARSYSLLYRSPLTSCSVSLNPSDLMVGAERAARKLRSVRSPAGSFEGALWVVKSAFLVGAGSTGVEPGAGEGLP